MSVQVGPARIDYTAGIAIIRWTGPVCPVLSRAIDVALEDMRPGDALRRLAGGGR